MAIGRRKKPLGTIAETTTPVTTGITQHVAGAAPGVIPSLTEVGQAQQPVSAVTPTPTTPPIGGIRPDIGFGGQPSGGVRPPGTAGQAEDMMPPTPAVPGVGELVGQFQEEAEAAKAANLARYEQGLGIHEQLVGDFGAGGTMEAAAMERYQRQKSQDIAGQQQQLVSAGLAGTTRPATLAASYEQQVGTPYKLGLAEAMAQRKAEAMRGQAGFIERREDIPPDPALMAGMVERAAAKPEEEAAPTSLWTSGQTGAITSAQFTQEAQRQQFFKTYTAQVDSYKTQIEQHKEAAKRFEPGSPQQAHYTNVIKTLQDQLKTAEENVKEYGEEKAGVSSVQYAEEEQRRTGAATTPSQPSMLQQEKERKITAGWKYVGGVLRRPGWAMSRKIL